MDLAQTILVQLIADGDAVWLPSRSFTRPRPGNVYAARQAFVVAGVPWSSDGHTESERKETQRALESLAALRAVEVRRPHRVKTLAVRLSESAETETRRLVGLPGLYAAWLAALEVARHSSRPPKMMTDFWISERLLIGNSKPADFGVQAAAVESMLLPALSRGYVVSNANVRGHVSYSLTPLGWCWLDGDDAPDVDQDVEPDPEAAELYAERLTAALHRLDTAASVDSREVGGLPLPCATEGLALSRVYECRVNR